MPLRTKRKTPLIFTPGEIADLGFVAAYRNARTADNLNPSITTIFKSRYPSSGSVSAVFKFLIGDPTKMKIEAKHGNRFAKTARYLSVCTREKRPSPVR